MQFLKAIGLAGVGLGMLLGCGEAGGVKTAGDGQFMLSETAKVKQLPAEPEQVKVSFKYSVSKGITKEKGICRRDPSDVIKVGDTWYVWYTRVTSDKKLYPSGYPGDIWYATSKDEGHTWTEGGEAVPHGKGDAFDSFGILTPNILPWKGKYYLYYTAVKKGFKNRGYSDLERTYIGVAVSDSPAGPWKKHDKPVLSSTRDPKKFDSFRVDDSCFIVRDGKIFFYFKGRQWNNTPRHTKMGLAISDNPLGPFKRINDGEPVQDSGHEVLVWPYASGVMSLVSNTGPNKMTIQYAADGKNFKIVGKLPRRYPAAPGLFRADLTNPTHAGKGVKWGIAMATYHGDPYLCRYEIKIEPAAKKKADKPAK